MQSKCKSQHRPNTNGMQNISTDLWYRRDLFTKLSHCKFLYDGQLFEGTCATFGTDVQWKQQRYEESRKTAWAYTVFSFYIITVSLSKETENIIFIFHLQTP